MASGEERVVNHQADVVAIPGNQFCLRWNNHSSTFSNVLGALREKDRYSDVTIACEGQLYNVHRLVLAVCSDYFDNILQNTRCRHPIIVLKDIKAEDLEALLSYMYIGETSINQADLSRLVKAAEVLSIKGLTVTNESSLYADASLTNIVRDTKPHIFATSNGNNMVTFVNPTPQPEISQQQSSSYRTSRGINGPPSKRRRKDDHTTESSIIPSSSNTTNPSENTVIDATVTVEETSNIVYQEAHPTTSSTIGVSVGEITVVGDSSRASSEYDASKHHLKEVQGHSLLQVVDDPLSKDKLDDVSGDVNRTGQTVVASVLTAAGVGKNTPTISYVVTTDQAGNLHAQPHDGRFTTLGTHLTATAGGTSPSGGQPQPLDEAVAEALAGPSGMQNWLGTGELNTSGFTTVESYTNTTTGSSTENSMNKHATHLESPSVLSSSSITANTPTTSSSHHHSHSRQKMQTPGSTRVNHKCPQCSYTTYRSDSMDIHLRTHNGEKPFACDLCDYKTARKWSLSLHRKTHTGLKPFKCPNCKYQASRKDVLKVHMKTHPQIKGEIIVVSEGLVVADGEGNNQERDGEW